MALCLHTHIRNTWNRSLSLRLDGIDSGGKKRDKQTKREREREIEKLGQTKWQRERF